jgi:hypothetical protein
MGMTIEQSWEWYKSKQWICGFNYVTSSAVNSTEMWQEESYDPETINLELGWAENIGFNSCRVFMQYLVWENDKIGMVERLERFLEIANKHKISVMPIFFDDCAFSGKQPYLGKQDDPIPGVHNSGWTPSPGHERVVDRSCWNMLEEYVTSITSQFADDKRIIVWDLYNEPCNSGMEDKSIPLAKEAFKWSRNGNPSQPIGIGVWHDGLVKLNKEILELSDIITFHNYGDLQTVKDHIAGLKSHGRPMICTEWMRRNGNSLFKTHIPLFKKEEIGCYSWGLVNGKTQTHFPWGSPDGAPEPEIWFHDVLRPNGDSYDPEEVEIIKKYGYQQE